MVLSATSYFLHVSLALPPFSLFSGFRFLYAEVPTRKIINSGLDRFISVYIVYYMSHVVY